MFGIMTFMFVLGLIALVLDTTLGFQQMQLLLDSTGSGIWSSTKTNIIIAVGATITRIMVRLLDACFPFAVLTLTNQYILSDVICAWRAVVLWNKDKRVIAILTLFILGTTGVSCPTSSFPTSAYRLFVMAAAAVSDLVLSLRPLFDPSHESIQDESPVKMGERALIMVGPTLGTNILSTGLIGWKAWYAAPHFTWTLFIVLTTCIGNIVSPYRSTWERAASR
jgi:hypothetical protein